MANTRVFFSDLKSGGKCSSVVEARLLRYWEARNVKRGGDLMWIDMLMIDVNVSFFYCDFVCFRFDPLSEFCFCEISILSMPP